MSDTVTLPPPLTGIPPSKTPATVERPAKVNWVSETAVTLLIVVNVSPGTLYVTKSPVVTIPAKLLPGLVKVDLAALPVPAVPAVTWPASNDNILFAIRSPLNVTTPTPDQLTEL